MLKRVLASTFALLCVAGTASAAPLVLPEDEPIFIKFNNIELVDTTLADTLVIPSSNTYYSSFTQGNWGVLTIETIRVGTESTPNEEIDTGVPLLFVDGQGGGQVTGIFYDIQLDTLNNATGGFLDLYWQEGHTLLSPSPTASAPTDADLYATGTFLGRIAFTPGIVGPGDCTTTIFTAQGANTTDGTGVADSYGNVEVGATSPIDGTTGLWQDVLNSNYFNNPCSGPLSSDFRFKNSFNGINSGNWVGDPLNGIIGLTSDDPAQAFTTAVPEPAALTLLGFGLLAIARARRRLV